MNCNHWWQRPVLLAGLLVCGVSLGIHQTQAAPSANLDQTRNGKFDAPENPVGIDVNGNAGFQNAHYLEGHGLPYRCVMTDLPSGTPITNLYLTLLDRVGVHAERIGDSTGKVEHLTDL